MRDEISSIGIAITDEMYEQLEITLDMLGEWNSRHNLTRLTERRDQEIYHVLDSLSGYRYFKDATIVLDIGTGAGFPGVPLAIIYPKKQFHLVDSNGKKIAYLRQLVAKLGLKNVTLYHDRIENISIQHVSVITARALSSPNVLIKMTEKLQPKEYVLYVGPNCEALEGSQVHPIEVPGSKKSHYIMLYTSRAE